MLSVFDLVAILLMLTEAFAWINHCLIRLPHAIGVLFMGLGASLVLIEIELAFPNILLYEDLAGIIRQIDFQATVLNGMLAFLLVARALHVADTLIRIVNGHLNSAIDDLVPWAYAPREELLRDAA